jgi:hypothetical protein
VSTSNANQENTPSVAIKTRSVAARTLEPECIHLFDAYKFVYAHLHVPTCYFNVRLIIKVYYVSDQGGDRRGGGEQERNKILSQELSLCPTFKMQAKTPEGN